MAKILVVDDEPQIRKMLLIALRSSGYEAIEAESGASALVAVARYQPDLVLLDLGLPDLDGNEVLAQLREWSLVPVIVLSVRESENQKVHALDSGAQDYVTKPFSVEELLARIRAHLRDRPPGKTAVALDDGRLRIDPALRQVFVEGKAIELTPKEYGVLSRLAANANRVLTQKQLLNEVWGPHHDESAHYLRIIISHLRQKIGDDPANPMYLKTEAGVGYRFLFKTKEEA